MAEVLEKSGWYITPMGYTKDGGVDIIAVTQRYSLVCSIEMLVHCKRPSKRLCPVSVEVVKELWAIRSDKAFPPSNDCHNLKLPSRSTSYGKRVENGLTRS